MNLIKPYDREALREQARAVVPFPFVTFDGFLDERFVSELSDSYPNFATAISVGQEFRAVNEKRKVQVTEYNRFPEPAKRLCSALRSPAFLQDLAYIFDTPRLVWDAAFVGGGMHLTASKGLLDVHIDFNRYENMCLYRRLNLLLYLNEHWKKSWGGALELWDKDVKTCHYSALPTINRCVIFATSEISYHGVTRVSCPQNITRKSFAVYYYTKEPPHDRGSEEHSTVFKARPNEHFKKFVRMPVERMQKHANAGLKRAKRELKKVLIRERD